MSSLARQLLGATGALTTVTGSVFGSGSLAIPAGVVLVTLTGQGGTGGDNSYYNPGQPYVAPSGYHPYVAPTYGWSILAETITYADSSTNTSNWPVNPTSGSATFSGARDLWAYSAGPPEVFTMRTCNLVAVVLTAAVDAYYDIPGQPYIAPSSGGGVYSGGNTTATLNSVTDTWTGGYGGVATSSVQTLASTGAGQTLTYSIASGGSLNYSYTY